MPNTAEGLIDIELASDYEIGNQFIMNNLPLSQITGANQIFPTESISTVGSTGAFSLISFGLLSEEQEIKDWSKNYLRPYIDLHGKQERFEEVKNYLLSLNPNRVEELEIAEKSYRLTLSGINDLIYTGIAMRNILEHFKGDLIQRAKQQKSENSPSWEKMSERLTKKGVDSVEYQEMIKQKEIWSEIHNELTKITKNLKKIDNIQLEVLWTKTIDHLYIIFGLIAFCINRSMSHSKTGASRTP